MHEKLIEEVLRQVEDRLSAKPAALLLGRRPTEDCGYTYVKEKPYSAVVIGSMDAWELLHFPSQQVLEALLEGKPVYYCQSGLDWKQYANSASRPLWSRLLAAQRQLQLWGAQPLRGTEQKLLTAQEVRRRLSQGLPVEGRLTPLARDILEGKP